MSKINVVYAEVCNGWVRLVAFDDCLNYAHFFDDTIIGTLSDVDTETRLCSL